MSNIAPTPQQPRDAGVTASGESVAVGSINVTGNVDGNIVVGNHNFVVNNNHGTIVYQESAPTVSRRGVSPRAPRAPRGFIGRDKELSTLSGWMAANEPVLLSGPDGVGKTTLLRQAANSPGAQSFKDGVIYLEGLDANGEPEGLNDLAQRLFDILYETNPQRKVSFDEASTYLGNTQPLVLIDRIELAPNELLRLPDLFPSTALLVASRKGLMDDTYQSLRLQPLSGEDAAEMLASKAGLSFDDSSKDALTRLCELLGNLPLAILVAANVLREKNIPLEDAFAEMNGMEPPSEDKLQAAIECAWAFAINHLTPEEQEMLAMAAAAPGVSIDRAWLEKTTGGKTISKSLEQMELLRANSPRLRPPDGTRELILQKAEINSLREKLVQAFEKTLEKRSLDFEYVADELANLLGLVRWAEREGRWEQVITLGRAVDPYLTLHGLWDAWSETLESILDASRQMGDQATEAWALHQIGTREIGAGTRQKAIKHLRDALQIRQEIEDREGAAYTQHNLDYLRRKMGGFWPWWRWGLGALFLSLLWLCTGITIISFTKPGNPIALQPTATEDLIIPVSGATPTPTNMPGGPGPDGQSPWEINFYSDRSGSVQIYIVDINEILAGNPPTAKSVTDIDPQYEEPVLSPDSKLVAALGKAEGTGSVNRKGLMQQTSPPNEIFIMAADGSEVVNVSQSAGDDSSPAWSPNGDRLAYLTTTRVPASGKRKNEIFIVDLAGNQPILLTPGGADYNTPVWSPEGDRIAYTQNGQLLVADIGSLENVLIDPKKTRDPVWSVECNQLTYIQEEAGANAISSITMDASLLSRNLVSGWRGLLLYPTWSKDCNQLAFLSYDTSGGMALNVFPSLDRVRSAPGSKTCLTAPKWAPDGRFVVFQERNPERGDLDIYLTRIEDGKTFNLSDHPAEDFFLFGACEKVEFYYP